jgi:predicted nucleic acid-binding protein
MEAFPRRGQAVSLVIDASAALAWLYPDETTPFIEAVFDKVIEEDAWVPSIWRLEVANSLMWSVRRGRMTLLKRDGILADLASLPIFDDSQTGLHSWGRTLGLADAHQLTVYDAAYLELASRLSLPLATLDEDLRKAAQLENVPLLGK